MHDAIQALAGRRGRYAGRGANHDGEPFDARLRLEATVADAAVTIDFFARLESGVIAHLEHAVVAPDAADRPALHTVNSNTRRLYVYALVHDQDDGQRRALTFARGDPDDPRAPRTEIRLDLWADGDLGYHQALTLPGAPEPRVSGVRMARTDVLRDAAGEP